MISTEFYYGQGLGNQLACYVTTRVIATDKGYDFGFSGIENFGDRRFDSSGLYFMDLDLGKPVQGIVNHYVEKELRLKMLNDDEIQSCKQCYVSEKHGTPSYRSYFNKTYGKLKIFTYINI